ncbi:MAG: hypothetical protein IKM45_04230 [Opitutales bacterium]|nr:hypothetical protein [Opitutales bacterium]
MVIFPPSPLVDQLPTKILLRLSVFPLEITLYALFVFPFPRAFTRNVSGANFGNLRHCLVHIVSAPDENERAR